MKYKQIKRGKKVKKKKMIKKRKKRKIPSRFDSSVSKVRSYQSSGQQNTHSVSPRFFFFVRVLACVCVFESKPDDPFLANFRLF